MKVLDKLGRTGLPDKPPQVGMDSIPALDASIPYWRLILEDPRKLTHPIINCILSYQMQHQ